MTESAASSSAELQRTADRLIGSDLDGRYRIDALLGTGGMGAVFRAYHRFMDQAVAIKVLRPNLARDPSAAKRFVREARGTLKVDSEHAVRVLDFAITDDGLLYMVLELLDGRTVGAELAADDVMAPRRAVRVARQACDALAAAHRVGLIHRDLKPDNIMLVRRAGDPDYAKVLDFGLAKVMEGTGEQALSMAALTQGGLVFGTPDYMAPEQALGQPLDARCDLYALGATLFEMLTGRPPFVAASPLEVLASHVRDVPPRLRAVRPELVIPDELEAVVARCLAKDPDQRPGSADALAAELLAIEALLAGPRRVVQAETMPVPAIVPRADTPDAPPARPWSAAGASTAGSADDLAPHRSRRPAVIIAIALLAAAALVVVVVTRPRTPGPTRGAPAHVAVAVAGADAGRDAGVADAGGALDATVIARDAGARDPGAGRAPTTDQQKAHLAAAEAARRAGNRLRQLAEADAALKLGPRNHQAQYLIGDALVGSGDLTKGCKYLRQAGSAPATARAVAVGCP